MSVVTQALVRPENLCLVARQTACCVDETDPSLTMLTNQLSPRSGVVTFHTTAPPPSSAMTIATITAGIGHFC